VFEESLLRQSVLPELFYLELVFHTDTEDGFFSVSR
jgi:hypothetical protein